jgi:hypothetical protein
LLFKEQFGILPSQYEEELASRSRVIEDNLNLIQTTSLNQEQRIMLQKFIEMSFKESLQLSGEQRQLDHLSIITNNFLNQNQNSQMGITNSSV